MSKQITEVKIRESQGNHRFNRRIFQVTIKDKAGIVEKFDFTKPFFFECINKVTVRKDIGSKFLETFLSYPATPETVLIVE